jgi:hypothetical protein
MTMRDLVICFLTVQAGQVRPVFDWKQLVPASFYGAGDGVAMAGT